MELDHSKTDDATTVILKDRIDANVAPDIEHKLLSLIREGSRKLVVDLSAVIYISSAGLRVMLAALKEAKSKGGDFRLARVPGHVKKLLDMVGFTAIFKIYASAEDATQSYREKRR